VEVNATSCSGEDAITTFQDGCKGGKIVFLLHVVSIKTLKVQYQGDFRSGQTT